MSKEDPYVNCPYNKSHWVSRSRLQAHIVKCEKNYPPLAICPYNATHRMPDDEISKHTEDCPSKASFMNLVGTQEIFTAPESKPKPKPMVVGIQNDSDEEWD